MPTYTYECTACAQTHEIIKSIAHLDDVEACKKCSKTMERIMVPVQINTSTCQFEAHFNHGLGSTVYSKRHMKEKLAQFRGETGKDIVEVGTDSLQSIKKEYKKYDEVRLGDYT